MNYASWLYVICYHVTSAFQSGSTLYSSLNVKELLARNRRDTRSLSDSNGIRTHNHLLRKWTLNHLTKLTSLAEWLSVWSQTKSLWVRISLLLWFLFECNSLYVQELIWLFPFQETPEFGYICNGKLRFTIYVFWQNSKVNGMNLSSHFGASIIFWSYIPISHGSRNPRSY